MGPAIVAPKSGVGWYGTTTAIAIVGIGRRREGDQPVVGVLLLVPGLGGTGLRGDVVLRGEPDPRRRAVGRGHDRFHQRDDERGLFWRQRRLPHGVLVALHDLTVRRRDEVHQVRRHLDAAVADGRGDQRVLQCRGAHVPLTDRGVRQKGKVVRERCRRREVTRCVPGRSSGGIAS